MVDKTTRTTDSRSAAATARSFACYLLSIVLALSACLACLPDAAYADEDDAIRFNYDQNDFTKTKDYQANYGQGMFYSKQSGRYVNSFQEYYVNFDDPAKKRQVANYTPQSNYEFSAVLADSLAIAATFGGPLGQALSIGFSFISAGIKQQEQAVIDAYGSDYAFTDWLIAIFEKGEAHKILYDKTFTIVTNYKGKVKGASSDTVKRYEEKNGKGSWATDKIGLKTGEFGVDAGLSRVASFVGAGTATPLADSQEMMFPPTTWDSVVEDTVTSKLNDASGDGEYSKDSILRKTKPEPSGGDRQLVYIEEKGYMVVIHTLSDEEMAYIQQLIYHLCSSADWRMMIAESRNLGIQISARDFQNSIQHMMGLELSPFFDFVNAWGWANPGHYLLPINGDAVMYGADYVKRYYQNMLGSGFEGMSKQDTLALLEQMIAQADNDALSPDAIDELWKLWGMLRDSDDATLNALGGGNPVIAKAIGIVAGEKGSDYVSNTLLPGVGRSLEASESEALAKLSNTLSSTAHNSAIVSNAVRGAAVMDVLVYVGAHDDMVEQEDAKHRIAIAYAKIKANENGGGYYSPYDTLTFDNDAVVAYADLMHIENRRKQVGEGNIWGDTGTTYWGLY